MCPTESPRHTWFCWTLSNPIELCRFLLSPVGCQPHFRKPALLVIERWGRILIENSSCRDFHQTLEKNVLSVLLGLCLSLMENSHQQDFHQTHEKFALPVTCFSSSNGWGARPFPSEWTRSLMEKQELPCFHQIQVIIGITDLPEMSEMFDGNTVTALFPSNSEHPVITCLKEMSKRFDGKPHSACFPSKWRVCLP